MSRTLFNPHSPFRLNVGFIVHQNVGYSREFLFKIPQIQISPDLELKDLAGSARITRTPQGLPVQLIMHAALKAQCSRCLTDFHQRLNIDFTELYAFSQRSVTDSELILPDDGHIDLTPLIREYMLLSSPINPLCRPDCKGLCPYCGENLNETTCQHHAEEIDPRLSGLKSLLNAENSS